MQPANITLGIVQGATLRETFRIMQSRREYRPISAVSSTAPVVLTVEHGLPADWPVWVRNVQQFSELNKALNQAPWFATVLDDDHLEINDLSGTGRTGVGGELVYHAPVDLTGATALLRLLDEKGALLLEVLPTVHAGGWIDIEMSDTETAALGWSKGTWQLDITFGNGDVLRPFAGAVYVSPTGTPGAGGCNWPDWVYTFGIQGPPGSGSGGGGSGLTSFNGRPGPAIVLVGSDVTNALGYAPVNVAALAAVAFDGSFDSLLDKPFIPLTFGDVGAASAPQGDLAETAVQPAQLAAGLDLRVEKVAGYGLSKNDLTDARAAKLDAMPDDHFKGLHLSEEALALAYPTANPGDYADVDQGVGFPTARYSFDVSDQEWVKGGSAEPLTAPQVLALYESNPDRNAFTDALEAKLIGVQANATYNPDTTSVTEGTNKYFTEPRVLGSLLAGLSLASNADVVDGDSVLVAFGKVQRRLNAVATALAGKVDAVAGKGLSTNDFDNTQKSKLDLIQAEATKNQTDAYLLARANHTGQVPANMVNGITIGVRYANKGVMNERRAIAPFTDQISQAPTAAYDLVRVVPGYAGPCIQIQRSSDNATKDIGFAPDGVVDTDAIINFQNGTAAANGYIYLRTFYDQSGNNHHMVNTGAVSTMPQVDCTYLRNGMPTIFTTTGRSLPIPSTVTIAATNNFAIFTAIGNYSPKATASPWALGTGTNCDLLLTPGTANSVQIRTNGVVNQYPEGAATLANSNGCVVGLNVIPTEMRWFRNNVTYTRATTAAGNTLATAGGTFMPAGRLDVYGMLIYNTGLPRADATLIQSAMTNANRCVYKPTTQLVLCGDSIGEGAYDFAHNYNKELWNYFGLNVAIYNVSLSGQTLASQAGEVATKIVPLYKTNMQNIALNHGGVNDITAGTSGTATYNFAVTWHTAVKAAGFTTLQMLLYNRSVTGSYTSAMEAERTVFNDLVRANTGVGKALGVDLVDVSLEPQNVPYIKTAFFPDNLHPNQAGNVLNAPQIANSLYTQMYAAA